MSQEEERNIQKILDDLSDLQSQLSDLPAEEYQNKKELYTQKLKGDIDQLKTAKTNNSECTINKILNYLLNLQTDLNSTHLDNQASGNNNNREVSEGIGKKSSEACQGSEKTTPKKKASWFGGFNRLCKTKGKSSSHGSNSGGSQGGSTRSRGNNKDDKDSAEVDIRKLQSDITQMINAFNNLNDFQNRMSTLLVSDPQIQKLNAILQKASSMSTRSHDLKEIRRKVFTLKAQIPSVLYKQSSKEMMISEDSQDTEDYSVIEENGSNIYLPSLHISKEFPYSSAFEEVLEKYQDFEITHKLCLLSFAVFPENREVNRTMLMYWWIGEGYISCDGSENDSVKEILDDFSAKRLLEPVEDESRLKPSSYKIDPHVHSAVIYLAKSVDLFKLYNEKGLSNYEKTERKKVCLVRGSSLQLETKTSKMKPGDLETVFNSSERYPDFTFKWFESMKKLKVLYLGRWERTAKRHIEVESTKFLKDIKELNEVKLVSFQGISRIEELENPICLLPNLLILDLKACYNLEKLPSDIGLLQKLIYLDVSDCYMLDGMPRGISKLSSLQVLKGFVIGEADDEKSCAVKHLTKLRKLSITVNKYKFNVGDLAESLKGIKQLQSLKIAWGARFPETDKKSEEENKAGKHKETTNEENEKQGGPPTDKKHKDEVEKKEQTSEDKKKDGKSEEANLEEENKHEKVKAESLKADKVIEGEKKANPSQEATETIQNKPEDQERKGNVEGDGGKGKVDLEEGKMKDEIKSESLKSEKAASPSREETETPKSQKVAGSPREETETIQNKPDNQEEKSNVEGDGDKGKVDPKEGKNKDEVGAEISKSDKDFEGEKKASSPQDASDMIQEKPDDKSKVEKEGDGANKEKADLDEGKKQNEVEAERTSPAQESKDMIDNKTDDKTKGKADSEEGKKHNEAEAGISKSNNGVEGVKKASSARESPEAIQNKPDHHEVSDKQEEKGDKEKEKDNQEEGKKHDEVEAGISKSNSGVEGVKKASPARESTEAIQNKQDDHEIGDKQAEKGDEEKEKANQEGKKHDEVEAGISKSNSGVEGVKKASSIRESTETIENKRDDHEIGDKQEKKGDEEKEKANLEGKKHDEVEAGISKSKSGVEGVEKASSIRESTETVETKRDDHEIGDKQQKKRDEEKEKANLEEGKKKDEVEADSSKPDKVIEESKEIVQSKPDDHREIRKVQEKGDGGKKGDNLKMIDEGAAKTQKSHKPIKFGKILSFSGKPKALIQKKRDDLKRDNAMTEENYETQSPSRPTKDPRTNKANRFIEWGQQTKTWGTGSPENPAIDHTPKLPSTLKKLELECFPERDPPKWLNPKDLSNLEKLSIKGGWLSRISNEDPTEENKWPVQILRLKYLHKFEVKWKDLQTLFPKMKLLEKYECPKIAFCPTDGNGVWRKPHTSPNM